MLNRPISVVAFVLLLSLLVFIKPSYASSFNEDLEAYRAACVASGKLCCDSDETSADPYKVAGKIAYLGTYGWTTQYDKCKNDYQLEEKNCKEYSKENPIVSHSIDCDKVYGEYKCSDGRCVSTNGGNITPVPPSSNCDDSDKGDIFINGVTSYKQGGVQQAPLNDWCANDKKLMEVTCVNGEYTTIPTDCPSNKCVDGACEKVTCNDPDGDLGIAEAFGYEYAWEHSKQSTTTAVSDATGVQYGTGTDWCAADGSNKLTEYYCKNGKVESKVKDCDDYDVDVGEDYGSIVEWIVEQAVGETKINFICSDGTCCPKDVKLCIDSDGGSILEEKGNTRIEACESKYDTDPVYDACGIAVCSTETVEIGNALPTIACPSGGEGMTAKIKPSDGKFGDFVKEFECFSGQVVYSWKKCSEGTVCQDGECKPLIAPAINVGPPKISVKANGETTIIPMRSYCNGDKAIMNLKEGLDPAFAGSGITVTPSIFGHYEEKACGICNDDNIPDVICYPIKSPPASKLNLTDRWKGFVDKMKIKLPWFNKP